MPEGNHKTMIPEGNGDYAGLDKHVGGLKAPRVGNRQRFHPFKRVWSLGESFDAEVRSMPQFHEQFFDWFPRLRPYRSVVWVVMGIQGIWFAWVHIARPISDNWGRWDTLADQWNSLRPVVETVVKDIFSTPGAVVTFALGFGYLILDQRIAAKQKAAGADLPPLTSGLPAPLVSIPEKVEVTAEPRKGWRPLTAQEIVDFIEFARPRKELLSPFTEPIKFVASDSGRVVADPIARTLVSLGYNVLVNDEDANYIFPAKRDLSGITIRYPSTDTGLWFRLGASLRCANLNGSQIEFPKSDQLNFVQIEIGDWTRACQWQ
jgi:hypothetical protein